jgi:hypothetical protein
MKIGDVLIKITCEWCGTQWDALCFKSSTKLECPGCHKMVGTRKINTPIPFTPVMAEAFWKSYTGKEPEEIAIAFRNGWCAALKWLKPGGTNDR